MLGRAHTEADIALEVSWFIVVALFTRTVLRKVFGGTHDKLSLVIGIRHPLGVNPLVEVSVGQFVERDGVSDLSFDGIAVDLVVAGIDAAVADVVDSGVGAALVVGNTAAADDIAVVDYIDDYFVSGNGRMQSQDWDSRWQMHSILDTYERQQE
ncbi:hypothetical protein NQ176_g5661 [Zarea fungicola]|uniref:Uncharacterized protein n=1 Tax=Zarea fungicola TaxID=93591 RepID=A0ACC1N833_9HYPO|nr:hypothetical protein NQ176_g5661 [Lecanicillium fungicola]